LKCEEIDTDLIEACGIRAIRRSGVTVEAKSFAACVGSWMPSPGQPAIPSS
jgi:hypothetical protein